jgi:hypothetical protein
MNFNHVAKLIPSALRHQFRAGGSGGNRLDITISGMHDWHRLEETGLKEK